ncbi:MAG: lysozyme inhibitor LprI family protein [Planktomarina sp.]
MMRLLLPFLFIFACVGSLYAQDLVFSQEATENCISESEQSGFVSDCVGESARQCVEDGPEEGFFANSKTCYNLEAQYWENELANTILRLKIKMQNNDAQLDLQGDVAAQTVRQLPALEIMQQTWTQHRDATCALYNSLYGRPLDDTLFITICLMDQTAKQATFLKRFESLLE